MRSLLCLVLFSTIGELGAQVLNPAPTDAKRVTVSQNNDGSRTTYEIDGETRKELATTINPDGKVQSRIRYDLDEAGRYLRGEVFGPRDELRFKTSYKYDTSGRLQEETQFTREGVARSKIVYSYDPLSGRQTGYTAYDAAGKLIGRSASAGASLPVPKKAK